MSDWKDLPLGDVLTLQRGFETRARTYRRADSATFTSQFTKLKRNRAARELYRSFMGSEWPAMLAGAHRASTLRTPTLFLHGAADPVITHKYVEDFDGRADDYRFELLPGLGHFPKRRTRTSSRGGLWPSSMPTGPHGR